MVVNCLNAINNTDMNIKNMTITNADHENYIDQFVIQSKEKADKYINYFLLSFFAGGLVLAFFYDTWLVAIAVGGLSLLAYYSSKLALPKSNVYQYVLSIVLGIFMAQYIYQMHGMFEMHFIAFVASAILIAYQNWKLQIPLTIVVVIHHAVFGYLQFVGFERIYFTKLEYMDLQTFIIHIVLAAVIFFICGLWAYTIKEYNERQIELSFEVGRLQEEEVQKEALSKTNDELRKSNMELDKFVYSVSHDLRAPLSSILGIVELAKTETDGDIIMEQMSLIKGNINKLDSFIKDILDYSRNARLDSEKEEINFKESLEDIINNLKYIGADNRKVDITYKIENETNFISDKSRIDIILNNLISNSIRYQNPETQTPFVNITVNTSDTEAHISVKDNGIGISKENHKRIFDMFYRISKKSVGSGLGLYIVKETIDKLEGRIQVNSEPGRGTEFNIKIPNLREMNVSLIP